MLYSLARPLLFSLAPERAHELTLSLLKSTHKMGLMRQNVPAKPVTCMGIQFPNPVGLAAGLDKNGAYIDALADLGFGFIEIGTITPRPQAGNPHPRLFRLPKAKAIINRMGFNNDGVDKLIENVKASKFKGILGINIGKNADTPVENAVDDYLICLEKVYNYASYITVNISSPNTKNLRSLQSGDALTELLSTLKKRQLELAEENSHYVPLVLKVAPDLEAEDVQFISKQLIEFKIDGLIVTNTTLSREGVEGLPFAEEAGGLSGAPVFEKSTACLAAFSKALNGEVPLIGVGGILSGEQAVAKREAGASLVQVYSGLIYTGPDLVKDCINAL
ncbi:quinone-dependent dihydroorotate dehydrogenase [Acinetobacter portensis]|uniref:Dihydroorotate dehydrogenase (quinone) n=2 Tax=Acinetobacter TaxID=469 RepID=A0A6L6GDR9_9GAMM|nr:MULTISPECIES: quinone-dependent dihydroorotate dehydrogenase [Acinetobacter]MCK7608793.1 quinone-dependent dihydroorotate dehydrogenase [Acinetobacter portensis]MCK7639615.1 quinone-dependent dihydroorotate dehydrogenase [Acinetobacter portensis]MDY6458610.1 quinone-dependent dihydroorotate dehydrogenase [Acinetobacter faecalis]MDY6461559.1 quinone-dependent dihydroorotate dehydrogenase [Acinetobacter faecalis]MDY6483730.1 quinone-dependent dihydroorotate dehydrogenase [Acinetobacter faecal